MKGLYHHRGTAFFFGFAASLLYTLVRDKDYKEVSCSLLSDTYSVLT
jgi:hypothetical protein